MHLGYNLSPYQKPLLGGKVYEGCSCEKSKVVGFFAQNDFWNKKANGKYINQEKKQKISRGKMLSLLIFYEIIFFC